MYRDDFPLLASHPEIAFLDSAATAQRPAVVLDAQRRFYETMNANPLRGLYSLSVEATGAIAKGALVAQELGLPFVYVRSAAKNRGLENLIEGEYKSGEKVVVVEDLISTGGSSLQAVEALRGAGCEVLGMVAIFTYGFQKAVDNFANARCVLDTLSDYNALIDLAQKTGYVKPEEVSKLKEWRVSPETYK